MKPSWTGAQIARQRRKYGWTQQELAERLGVALSTIWRWESSIVRPSKLAQRQLERVFVPHV